MSVKDKIQEVLGRTHPGEDFALFAFGIPYGYFVWDIDEGKHRQLKTKDLDEEIRAALPVVKLTKEDVFGA